MKKPSVAVVILNWNNYKDTSDCVESLMQITYDNFNIVIVDNNSSDNSGHLLQTNYKQCVVIINPVNDGYARGNNIGITYALDHAFDYVLLLNNDTVVENSFLEPLVECLETKSKAMLVGGKICFFDNRNIIWTIGGDVSLLRGSSHYYGCDEEDKGQYDKSKKLTHISGCMTLIRSALFAEIGFINPQYFLRGSEWDLCYEVKQLGYDCYYIPESVIYHKVSQTIRRYTPWDIYDGYMAKLIFTRKFMPLPVWVLWFFGFSFYAYLYAPYKFRNMARDGKYTDYNLDSVKFAMKTVIKDGFRKKQITEHDINRIKDWCMNER